MLSQLQPNIVKGHVREHLRILLVQFYDKAEGRAFLKAVGGKMKSAKKHLQEVEQFNADGTPGTRVRRHRADVRGLQEARHPDREDPGQRRARSRSASDALGRRRSRRSPTRRSRRGRSPTATRSTRSCSSATPTRRRCSPSAREIRSSSRRRSSSSARRRASASTTPAARASSTSATSTAAASRCFSRRTSPPSRRAKWDPAFALGRVLVRGLGGAEARAAVRQLLRPAQARAERARLPQGRGGPRDGARPDRQPTARAPAR